MSTSIPRATESLEVNSRHRCGKELDWSRSPEGTRKIHINFVLTRSDAIGGAFVHVRDLSLMLCGAGHQVEILIGRGDRYVQDMEKAGVYVRKLKHLVRPVHPWHDLLAFWELRRVLTELKPDLVSTHSAKAGIIGRLASRSLGIPNLFTAHGWIFTEGTPRLRGRVFEYAEKWVEPFSDLIITVSEYDRQLAICRKVTRPEKIVTVHNGMPDIPPHLCGEPAKHPVKILMVARFEPQKDHGTLFRALGQIRQLNWSLDLVGEGPLRARMEGLACSLGIRDRVNFLGARMDVVELMAQAQIYALISNWEGFPRSILEAMRAGIPVIASDVGGIREAVIPGETGFLVPRKDDQKLRQLLVELLLQPDLRAAFGKAAKARFQKSFRAKIMLDETVEQYRRVLKAKPGI